MPLLLVVDNPEDWPLSVPGVEVLQARRYLTDPGWNAMRNVRLFNLCRSYSYQSTGYYVSLLAEARGHRPQPDVVTIQDMKSASLVRVITDDLDSLIQKTLHPIRHDEFTLSIYFGRTLTQRDRALGRRLFGLFRSPLLRAQFALKRGRWTLQGVRPIPSSEIPPSHHPEVIRAAEDYFTRRQWSGPTVRPPRYYMGLLVDTEELTPPSDEGAIERFIRAANRQAMGVELISRDDYGRVGEFDALFIRTTTYVNHYTYRFARRAKAEGLAVIDDPVSIARCCNKVYLAERLEQNRIPIPKTVIVHRDNAAGVIEKLGLPVVLKQPDSAYSVGVVKASTRDECRDHLRALLEHSELVIAQEYIPTRFDWRVGVLDGQPLYVCRYHMAARHWQIVRRDQDGRIEEGYVDTLPLDQAPKGVVATGVRAANLIGDGLYGVDIKEVDGKLYVMEVNDNPSIDAGIEDEVLRDRLYDAVITSFIQRIERIREGNGKRVAKTPLGPV